MNMHVGSELALELHRQAVERRKRMGMISEPMPGQIVRVARGVSARRALARVLYPAPIGPRDFIFVRSDSDVWRVQRIIDEVLFKHGISKTDFLSRRRLKPIVNCRHEACYRLRHETRLSTPQIADVVGVCDHSVVLYAVKRWTRLLEASPSIAAE